MASLPDWESGMQNHHKSDATSRTVSKTVEEQRSLGPFSTPCKALSPYSFGLARMGGYKETLLFYSFVLVMSLSWLCNAHTCQHVSMQVSACQQGKCTCMPTYMYMYVNASQCMSIHVNKVNVHACQRTCTCMSMQVSACQRMSTRLHVNVSTECEKVHKHTQSSGKL